MLDDLERDPSIFSGPVYLATVERDGDVVGCAFRTPPYKLGLTRMPMDALAPLAADVADFYEHVPTAMGPVEVASGSGACWAGLRAIAPREGGKHRIHVADAVRPLDRRARGAARAATIADREPVARLLHGFLTELDLESGGPKLVEMRLRSGAFWLWEDEGRPVSLAGLPARTPRWARVGYVYTPPELRNRGYATNLVAELTARVLADGARYVVLYTDLANPTSNAIYRRIGYRPLVDVVDVHLGDPATT